VNQEHKTPPALTPERLQQLLGRLSEDARQGVEAGLGEALRLGHFWLGIEFLLMGLSRGECNGLWELLQTLDVKPGDLRGMLRGIVGVREKDWREQKEVRTLGAAALPRLQKAHPASLAILAAQGQPVNPVITPRMWDVLRQAAQLAGSRPINPNHLLLAAMQHPRCLVISVLIGMMVEHHYEPRQFLERLLYLSGTKTEREWPPEADAPWDFRFDEGEAE
jgi:hypothetical protein